MKQILGKKKHIFIGNSLDANSGLIAQISCRENALTTTRRPSRVFILFRRFSSLFFLLACCFVSYGGRLFDDYLTRNVLVVDVCEQWHR